MSNAYDVLGIHPHASRAELERSYAERMAAYDPGEHAHLPEEFVQLARQRQAELTAAYQSLRAAVASPVCLTPAAERRRDRETIVALLVLIVVTLLVPLLRNVAVPTRSAVAEGADAAALTAEVAPDFTLEVVGGQQVSLSDYKGQVVLVNLWATWCPPCVRETPRLVRLYEQYKDQGFVLLGVNTTYQDERADVEQFVRDQKVSYPVLLDTDDSFGQAYRARVLPTSYLIDREGRIVQVRVGEIDEAQLAEQIEGLLRTESATR